jgi:hypothetical protein
VYTIRYFIEIEIAGEPLTRNQIEEGWRDRLKRFIGASDPRIAQYEVVYIPEMLAPRVVPDSDLYANVERSPFDGRGVLQDGSTPERMR